MRPNPWPLLRLLAAVPVILAGTVLMVVCVPVWYITAIPIFLASELLLLISVLVGVVNGRAGHFVAEIGNAGMEKGGDVLDAVMSFTFGWYIDHVVEPILR